jgi:hypothetical protein
MSCVGSLLEVEMPKGNLASMSVDALLKLRDDIEKVLGRKANELKHQLSRLGDEIGSSKLGRRSSLKDRKLAVKYRDKSGNAWAGRGKTAELAAGEVESRCKAGRLCCPQSTASSPEGPQDKTVSMWAKVRTHQSARNLSTRVKLM